MPSIGFGPGDTGTAVRSAVTRLLWLENSPYVGNSRRRALSGSREGAHGSRDKGLGVRTGPLLRRNSGGLSNSSGHLAWHADPFLWGVQGEAECEGAREATVGSI